MDEKMFFICKIKEKRLNLHQLKALSSDCLNFHTKRLLTLDSDSLKLRNFLRYCQNEATVDVHDCIV